MVILQGIREEKELTQLNSVISSLWEDIPKKENFAENRRTAWLLHYPAPDCGIDHTLDGSGYFSVIDKEEGNSSAALVNNSTQSGSCKSYTKSRREFEEV